MFCVVVHCVVVVHIIVVVYVVVDKKTNTDSFIITISEVFSR